MVLSFLSQLLDSCLSHRRAISVASIWKDDVESKTKSVLVPFCYFLLMSTHSFFQFVFLSIPRFCLSIALPLYFLLPVSVDELRSLSFQAHVYA